MATLKQLLADGESALTGSDSARLDTELLLACVLRKPRAWLYTWPDHIPAVSEQNLFLDLLRRRKAGEPIAYLTGRREFWKLGLFVNEHVLIPRPETELLVETVLEKFSMSEKIQVADLGTGSGAIALAIAHERPEWLITATDNSAEALVLAKKNAAAHGIENISFIQGEWLSPLDENQFTVIVSNPPYIEAGDKHLEEGDVRFEPRHALISQDDGLADIKSIVSHSRAHLEANGWLMLEHGYLQGERVRQLFHDSGYREIETLKDLAGHERVTMGSR